MIEVKNDIVSIDYGTIKIDSKDTFFKYDQIIEFFDEYLDTLKKNKTHLVVIEDVFFSKNVNVLKMLSRIGMIIYVLATLKHLSKTFILATSARCKLGLKGTAKKEEVQTEFLEKIKTNIEDEDCIDAIILACTGIIEEDLNSIL